MLFRSVGVDKAVHLTDPSGRSDLVLARMATSSCPVCHSPPVWSPSGQLLGFTKPLGKSSFQATFLEPMSGRSKGWSKSGESFIGWIDSERYLESNGPYNPFIVSVDGGRRWKVNNSSSQFEFIAPAPPHSPGRFIGMYYDSKKITDVIAFFHKDLSVGRPVWIERRGAAPGQPQSQVSPRVDPLGQYVAWTLWRKSRPYIAYKGVNELSSAPPSLLGDQYSSAYFCDWTEQADLLANVKDKAKWKLVILRRDGTLSRELGTDVPPAEGVVASWRKYEHR